MLRYLQHIAVLDPGQVLAGVVAQLTDPDSHALMLSHMLPQVGCQWSTASGDPVQVVGAGDLARCLQHETDHLDGVLFIDRMDAATRKEAMKVIREANWNGPVKTSPHRLTERLF